MASSWQGNIFFLSSRRGHTRLTCDWSSDVCSSDLGVNQFHDRGFAGAGVAGEKRELPLGDVKGDVLERQAALGEGLEDVGELDHLVSRQGLGEIGRASGRESELGAGGDGAIRGEGA